MDFQLVVLRGRSASTALKLGDGVTTAGRHDDCQLRIKSSEVSRRHCQFFEKNGMLLVKDLGSSNGTMLNGKKIEGQRVLEPGDELTDRPGQAAGREGRPAPPGREGAPVTAAAPAGPSRATPPSRPGDGHPGRRLRRVRDRLRRRARARRRGEDRRRQARPAKAAGGGRRAQGGAGRQGSRPVRACRRPTRRSPTTPSPTSCSTSSSTTRSERAGADPRHTKAAAGASGDEFRPYRRCCLQRHSDVDFMASRIAEVECGLTGRLRNAKDS